MRSLARGEKGRVYLNFGKAFDAVSRGLLVDKLAVYRLEKWTVRWIAERLGPEGDGQQRKVWVEASH